MNTIFRLGPLGRPQQRARLLVLRPQRRPRARHGRREPPDPHDERPGPDRAGGSSRLHPALRRGDAFLHNSPVQRELARRRPLDARPGHRRRRRPPLLGARQGASGRLRQLAADDVHGDRVRTSTRRARCCSTPSASSRTTPTTTTCCGCCSCASACPSSGGATTSRCSARCAWASGGCSSWGDELGWDELETFVGDWFDYSETVMGDVIARLPSGRVESISRHDTLPGRARRRRRQGGHRGAWRGGRIDVDLRDNVDCMPNGLNLTESTARTAAMVGVFNSIGAGVPPNAGSFRRIERAAARELRVSASRGTPRAARPRPRTSRTVLANAVQRGLPSSATASGSPRRRRHPGGRRRRLRARSALRRRAVRQPDLHGHHRRGRHAVDRRMADDLPRRRRGHAAARLRSRSRSSGTRCIVEAQRLEPDSEGAGRYRGAPGAYVEYGPRRHLAEGRVRRRRGREPGARCARRPARGPLQALQARRATGASSELPPQAFVELAERRAHRLDHRRRRGLRPARSERDPERVRHDVVEGWVTPRARSRGLPRRGHVRPSGGRAGDRGVACGRRLTPPLPSSTFAVSAQRTCARIVERGEGMSNNRSVLAVSPPAIVCVGLAAGVGACGGDDEARLRRLQRALGREGLRRQVARLQGRRDHRRHREGEERRRLVLRHCGHPRREDRLRPDQRQRRHQGLPDQDIEGDTKSDPAVGGAGGTRR